MARIFWMTLVLALSLPAFGNDALPTKSILLVARKDLPDPFFRESVVLITPSRVGPPIGVIVNRPTEVPLSSVFPDIEGLRSRDEKLYFGGPVARAQLVAVFRAAKPPAEGALEILDGVFMSSDKELFRELLGRENPVEGLRVFAGYAGWAPGQLEAEVARGDWHLANADARALFGKNPERLWQELERRASARKTRFIAPSPAARDRGPACPRGRCAIGHPGAPGAAPRS